MKINPERLILLNQGIAESSNLMETVAIDFNILFSSVYPKISRNFNDIKGITKKMVEVAQEIIKHHEYNEIPILTKHSSDIVRGWACYIIGLSPYDLETSLNMMKPLADDRNSGVKEWAWLSMRKKVAENIEYSIQILKEWARDDSANIRRFASEITRPRGVWSSHIPELKKDPNLAIELLNILNKDSAKYVQNSVGNWLNDAAKDNKSWVQELCTQWSQINHINTNKIIKRGLRNIL